jgi:hypothetical protein
MTNPTETPPPADQGLDPADRLLLAQARQIVTAAADLGVPLRLHGNAACAVRCTRWPRLAGHFDGRLHTIDVAGPTGQRKVILALLADQGFGPAGRRGLLAGRRRRLFTRADTGAELRLSLGSLELCHTIPLKGRLENGDATTLPVAELCLERLQADDPGDEDLGCLVMLLLEHPLGEDDEALDAARLGELVSRDWALWRSAMTTLHTLEGFCRDRGWLNPDEQGRVLGRVARLKQVVRRAPKSMGWKTRSMLSDRGLRR